MLDADIDAAIFRAFRIASFNLDDSSLLPLTPLSSAEKLLSIDDASPIIFSGLDGVSMLRSPFPFSSFLPPLLLSTLGGAPLEDDDALSSLYSAAELASALIFLGGVPVEINGGNGNGTTLIGGLCIICACLSPLLLLTLGRGLILPVGQPEEGNEWGDTAAAIVPALEELKRDSESCIFIQQQGASKQQSERPVCKGKMPPPLPIEVLLLFVSNDDFK
mmetsp:Transcript_46101/g.76770  ORF Transcript_46101/g.76770 Transcript_46101/m.76770 type:complete len:219 (-) Transcript_46101:25-681(-)